MDPILDGRLPTRGIKQRFEKDPLQNLGLDTRHFMPSLGESGMRLDLTFNLRRRCSTGKKSLISSRDRKIILA